ncbi:MAG TPA: FkbM family methyltransferase [Pseudolabrys sp.]|nr:FkbM family methyltransferase [Pseudolabrys sp.]
MSEPTTTISYAQRYEDLYLARCFGSRSEGFYIDIGSGHPVFDNVSFAFYLKGWRGITVEPNPWLTRLSRAVRPRDTHLQVLIGAAQGEATFYLVDDYHGFSTTVAAHAQAAQSQFGKASQSLTMPVRTLSELAREAPERYEFLKIDVEGAEKDVLAGGDWLRSRPQIIIIEALAAFTQEPAWEAWESFLAGHGYHSVFFDSLNRYYLANEAQALKRHFADAPAPFPTAYPGAVLFRDTKPAVLDTTHPDHRLATVINAAAMRHLPLWDSAFVLELLTADVPAAELDKAANTTDVVRVFERLFGTPPSAGEIVALDLAVTVTLREVYAAIIDSDVFRTACGRISASYGW